MNEFIKLAWRNIWRNKRRTLITSASIFFAVFFALVMRSFQLGTYDHWISGVVETFSGYLQVQDSRYFDDPLIDHSMTYTPQLQQKIDNIENVIMAVPRLQVFSLASSGEHTKGVSVLGVDTEKENKVTKLKDKLVTIRFTEEVMKKIEQENFPDNLLKKIDELKGKSFTDKEHLKMMFQFENDTEKYIEKIAEIAHFENSYFKPNDNGVLVADRLSKFLKLNVGDTIIFMGQGYHGVSAAGKYPVRGIIRIPNPQLDNMLIYMPLKNAQQLFSTYRINGQDTTFLITNMAVNLKNHSDAAIEATRDKMLAVLNTDKLAVKTWKELNKEMVQQIESDDVSGQIMLGLLYLIIGFGIFGTVLMMTSERKREFGVMVAVGMQKTKLMLIIFIEMIFVAILGLFSGILFSVPVVLWGYYNPIQLTGDMAQMTEQFGIEPVMPFAWFDFYYVNQSIVVLILVVVSIIYPLLTIRKLNVIKAIHG